MKKGLLTVILAGVMCLCASGAVHAGEPEVEGAVVLSAADADFTEGEGISAANEPTATAYEEEFQMITNLAQDGSITYTVPEGTEGISRFTSCIYQGRRGVQYRNTYGHGTLSNPVRSRTERRRYD